MIVTGAAKGIGAGVAKAFVERGYNVVANSRDFAEGDLAPSQHLALVEGDVAVPSTAVQIGETALNRFGSIDGVVNNAGLYFAKPFTDFSAQDFERLSATNLLGYINVTQLAVKQMLQQRAGGSVIALTSAMVEHPLEGVKASIPMLTKGGLEALTRSLAMEYAKQGIRFNAVAPGVVNTRPRDRDPHEDFNALSPMGGIPEISDIVDAILYLTEARYVTGEVLHVDGGMHNGKWDSR